MKLLNMFAKLSGKKCLAALDLTLIIIKWYSLLLHSSVFIKRILNNFFNSSLGSTFFELTFPPRMIMLILQSCMAYFNDPCHSALQFLSQWISRTALTSHCSLHINDSSALLVIANQTIIMNLGPLPPLYFSSSFDNFVSLLKHWHNFCPCAPGVWSLTVWFTASYTHTQSAASSGPGFQCQHHQITVNEYTILPCICGWCVVN